MIERDEVEQFERGLAEALVRVDAPQGFADRVVARTAVEERGGRLLGWPVARRWYPLAALLLVGLATLLTAYRVRQYRVDEERQQRVGRQFEQAVQITDQALDRTREQMQRAGIQLEP